MFFRNLNFLFQNIIKMPYIPKMAKEKSGVTGNWTQGLLYAKQALYQLSYNPAVIYVSIAAS